MVYGGGVGRTDLISCHDAFVRTCTDVEIRPAGAVIKQTLLLIRSYFNCVLCYAQYTLEEIGVRFSVVAFRHLIDTGPNVSADVH